MSPAETKIPEEVEVENPLHRLTDEQIEAIGKEFDDLHDEVFEDLGERDSKYIHGIIDLHRRLALLGRVLTVVSRYRPMWLARAAALPPAQIPGHMGVRHNGGPRAVVWVYSPRISLSPMR